MNTKILDSLHRFKDGYISGSELAGTLKVSRTAVWNHIEYLREQGYSIEAHPRLGYRLKSVPDRLLPDEIQRDLTTKYIGRKLWVYEMVTSTNDTAWELAIKDAPSGSVVFAESQSKGRGRIGRSWFSPKRKGLWFSVILRPNLQPVYAPMITIAGSIAVAKAIMKHTGLSVWIKWPNDIYINNRKLGGILTEMNTELDRIKFVILGIGINVNIEPQVFPKELQEKAVSIKCSRIEVVKEIMVSLEFYYNMLNKKNWDTIINEWKNLSLVLGKRIKLAQGKKYYDGQAVGIDQYGALILRQDDGFSKHFTSGDIQCF